MKHTFLLLLITTAGFAQTDFDVNWIQGPETNLFWYSQGIPGKDGSVGVINYKSKGGKIFGYQVSTYKSNQRFMGPIKLLPGDMKYDYLSVGATSIGGDIFTYERGFDDVGQESFIQLNSADGSKSMELNAIKNPGEEDVVISLCANSPSLNYSAVYSYTVLPKSTRQKVTYNVPYVGLLFAYMKPREPEFYERIHVISLFDNDGNLVSERRFTMGGDQTCKYVEEIDLLDDGTVYMRVISTEFRYFYQDSRDGFFNKDKSEYETYTLNIEDKEPTKPEFLNTKGMDGKDYALKGEWKYIVSEHGYFKYDITLFNDGFTGFFLCDSENDEKNGIHIPVDLYDLRNTISDEDKKKLDKGKSMEIGIPEIRWISRDGKGGYYIILEEFRSIHQTDNTGREVGDGTYYYDNVVVLEVDKYGKIEWGKTHEQSQVITSGQYVDRGGIGVFEVNSEIYIIQNDVSNDNSWRANLKPEFIRIRKLDANGAIDLDERLEAGHMPISPRETFVNQNGDVILLGTARRLMGASGTDESIIGVLQIP